MSINPTEPSVTTGLSVAGVSAVLAVIDQFSLPISQTWKLVIAFGIVVLAPLVHGWITRGKVWSPATVAKLQADALGLVASIEAEQP
ncbi:MAG: hypothetical protein ACRDQG_16835, partial [Pseudonocardiaceae bacterium]